MTLIIKHRVNTKKDLLKTHIRYGIEIDIRSNDKKIYLSHEPFEKGYDLNEFLKFYNHKFIIANIKEEGIEEKVIEIFYKNKIKNFFLLDTTVPKSLKIKKGKNILCLRRSEIELLNYESKIINRYKWIWCDYLNKNYSLNNIELKIIAKKKFRLCFTSPELVNKNYNINLLEKFFTKYKIRPDCICTKKPDEWFKIINDNAF